MALHLEPESPINPCPSRSSITVGKLVTEEAARCMRKELSEGGSRGVLITWDSDGSYVVRLSDDIPSGVIYECLARSDVT